MSAGSVCRVEDAAGRFGDFVRCWFSLTRIGVPSASGLLQVSVDVTIAAG